MIFKKNYLVIYDITSDKVRKKIVKELEKYGTRVQYSAFECVLNIRTKLLLINELNILMGKGDSVRLYKLPNSVYVIGKGEEKFENETAVLVM